MHSLIKGKQTVKWSESMKQNIFRRFSTVGLCVAILLTVLIPSAALAETTAGEAALQITSQTPEAQDVRTQNETPQGLTFPVHVIHKTGDDKENFVIVIMADGYTKEQQDQFVQDATRKAQEMLTWSPYKDYSDRINIYALQVVSRESGIGTYGAERNPDTYFHVQVYGKAAQFTNGGTNKAKALRDELEKNYLDAGASVGTIHILSNASGNFGASISPLFSFSQNRSNEDSNDSAMTHEVSHSIGRLKDEYGVIEGPNVSKNGGSDSVPWKKLLGFHRIGITEAGAANVYAPARTCMMRELGQPFCEVCKMELIRRLNSTDYVSQPIGLYLADPEVTKEHNPTAVHFDPKSYIITESNITEANQYALEFRTIVQNMENRERHLKVSFQILTSAGTVKREKEDCVTIPALSNFYDPDAARVSVSVVIPWKFDDDFVSGDKINAKIIDADTGEVLATDKTAAQRRWSTVNLHYVLREQDGKETPLPQVTTAKVYIPNGATYTLRNPEINGYSYVGNSIMQGSVKITQDSQDITYYYQEREDSTTQPGTKPNYAPCSTRAVQVPYDGKPHTFDLRPGEGVTLRYSMTANGAYNLPDLPSYTQAGKYVIYYEASADSMQSSYGRSTLEITKTPTALQMNPSGTKLEGASAVTLRVFKTKMPEHGAVTLDCNDSAIKPMPQGNDTWKVDLPNKTQTYTFTARYSGDNNYLASEDTCQIAVTAKGMQPGGNASGGSGSSGGSSGGGTAAGGGASGGGGGGGAAPAPTPAGSDVVTVKDDKGNAISGSNVVTTTKATVSNTKNETSRNEQGQTVSKITGTVSKETAEKLVAQAVSNRSDTIEITVSSAAASSEAAATAKSTELEIPKATVDTIVKETNADLVVKTSGGAVSLDNKTLETIAKEASGDTVKIVVKENAALSEAQQAASAAIGENGKLFDFAAQIGDRLLHDFQGGKAHVTLPMPQKLKGKEVLVVYIDDSGLCKVLNHSLEKVGADDYVRFTTTHFSTFAIVDKAEAEKLIAAQNADHIKALMQNAQYKVTTSKTSKKSVKVQVAAKSDKTLLTDIKNMGYTVKYQFYRSTKKDAGYKLRKTSSKNSFISTKGTKGRKYYYKARVLVYDGSELVARSALKQCSYGARTWTK